MDRRIALAAALALVLPAAAALTLSKSAQAQPAGRCTRETLNVRGTPLTVAYCIVSMGTASPGRELPVRVNASYATARGSWSQDLALQFIDGEDPSRVIQDLALDHVGLQGTLHLTLVLRGGAVRVDSAMLTPGAVTIK
jgi:hypothetical protein